MSINNRKYIQSTGSLLTRLNEETTNPTYQHQQRESQHQHNSYQNVNYNRQGPNGMAYQQNANYSNMQQYSTGSQGHGMYGNSFGSSGQMFPAGQVPAQAAAIAAQLVNKMTSVNGHQSIDIPMIQGLQQHQQQQQRWPKTQKHHNYKRDVSNKMSQPKKQSSTTSSVTELPETFGLPSNKKYVPQKLQDVSMTDDKNSTKKNDEKLVDNSADIEIINEEVIDISKNDVSVSNRSDDTLRNYLGRNFKEPLAINPKPQCNFISNFTCINQLLTDCDYYTMRRCKPYSNLKLRNIYTDNDNESDNDDDESTEDGHKTKKLKSTHVIVIDDTNEEMHKPWITPDLIKLIKHRNLLQSKLNEKNGHDVIGADGAVEPVAPDPELLKKFKNLRNKVTKLVKKARKDYLVKYIAESKENKISSTEPKIDTNSATALSQQAPPPPPPPEAASTTSMEVNETQKPTSPKTTTKIEMTASELSVKKITADLKLEDDTSFLKSQNKLMMGLYNQYYSQYMKQYEKQQTEAHDIALKAMEAQKKKENPENEKEVDDTASGYELLRKQAEYYSQQQAAIQAQLEASLSQSAQQLIKEISQKAAAQAQKPFVLNQFSHQQQHHPHQHHHINQTQNIPQFNQGQFQPQPIGAQIGPQPSYEATQQQQIPQQQPYNIHYNYNMVVS